MADPRDPGGDEAEEAYDPEYLREVAGGDARQKRLEELKRRIELGAYHPDPTSIAEGMLSRAGEPAPRDEAADDDAD
jgi:anti-sigma28 factor (negative regulator of flagellin synthesis)